MSNTDWLLVILFMLVYGIHKSRVGFIWQPKKTYSTVDRLISVAIVGLGLALAYHLSRNLTHG